ncbi:MAG TPA: hypothetical protein VI072_16530 [Polyangiaceae bacterium]
MRCRSAILAASFALFAYACGSDDDDNKRQPNPEGGAGTAGSGGGGGGQEQDGSSGSGGSDAGPVDGSSNPDAGFLETCTDLAAPDAGDAAAGDGGPTILTPRRVVAGAGVPLGVTDSGYVVFRDMGRLLAADLSGTGTPFEIVSAGGTTNVRGPVVLHWSEISYETGRATLTMWTGARCVRSIQNTLLAEDAVAVSANGSHLLYPVNVTDTAFDVVLATRDFASRQVVAASVGRASDTTCRPRYGFAGANVVLATCAPGSLDAKLRVLKPEAGSWMEKTVSDAANGVWIASASGQRLVYTDNRSRALYWDGSDAPSTPVDDGVGWLRLNPAGTVLLYGAGDQMRRMTLPPAEDQLPRVLLTRNFRNIAAWSPNDQFALYSSRVDYEGSEKRDLLLARSDTDNLAVTKLVATITARLSRSAFTQDSRYALYLSDIDAQGAGNLSVRALPAGATVTEPKVDTVLALRGSRVLFSANRNDAAVPVVAELKLLDAATIAEPVVLQQRIVDGRNFHLTPDRYAVVYARPAQSGDARIEGIWVHPVLDPVDD